jgi:Protein of unknown function (DUF1360)
MRSRNGSTNLPVGGEGSVTHRLATRFALASLATWRVTHLLAEEDGPADVVVRVRARLGTSFAGELMDCFACMSVWVAAPVSLTVARRARDVPVAWLALSGAACLLERVTKEREAPHGGVYVEEAAREGLVPA